MQQTDSDRPSGVPKTINTGTREESERVGFLTTRIQDGSPTAAREETRVDQYKVVENAGSSLLQDNSGDSDSSECWDDPDTHLSSNSDDRDLSDRSPKNSPKIGSC